VKLISLDAFSITISARSALSLLRWTPPEPRHHHLAANAATSALGGIQRARP
jgi:hypothetical protein